jgi:HEAT repeat protein
LALLALMAGAQAAFTQAPKADPVECLRRTLRTTYQEPEERDKALRACVANLRALGDLRRALTLAEWRDAYPDQALAAVDGSHRRVLLERFAAGVRDVLRRGDVAAVTEMVNVLAEMATPEAASPSGPNLARQFAPDLAHLVRQGPPRVRMAAARALGLIEPDETVAGPALAELLQSPDPALRRAGVEGLANLLQRVAQSATGPIPGLPPRASRSEIARSAGGVVPGLGRGLGDWQVEVRRRCAAALSQAAETLLQLIPDPPSALEGEEPRHEVAPAGGSRSELRPLALALRDQGAALARALRDGDTEVRLQAQRALEDLAKARLRWLRLGSTPSPNDAKPVAATADDPLAEGMRAALPNLAAAVADPEVRVRRAAIDVMEIMGPLALNAAPALARALNDPDRFVRWSAARTLGALGPGVSKIALPGLTRLLADPDADLRLAAAAAIERLNPSAQVVSTAKVPNGAGKGETALTALVRSLRSGDLALRVAALRTIKGMGPAARGAVPALREALGDPDAHVRQAAAETLGALGPSGRDAVEELRKAVTDPSPDVRRAAGDALLNVMR